MESKMEISSQPHETSLLDHAQIFKAVGDETRLRMLGLLTHGELCVCDIMAVLKLPQSTASRHLAYLKNAKWVTGTRRGKWMYYQLKAGVLGASVQGLIIQYLSGLETIKTDYQVLVCHLKTKDAQSCS